MDMDGLLLAYLGPETLVPAASVIATIIGGLLAFARIWLRWVAKGFAFLSKRRTPTEAMDNATDSAASPHRSPSASNHSRTSAG